MISDNKNFTYKKVTINMSPWDAAIFLSRMADFFEEQYDPDMNITETLHNREFREAVDSISLYLMNSTPKPADYPLPVVALKQIPVKKKSQEKSGDDDNGKV